MDLPLTRRSGFGPLPAVRRRNVQRLGIFRTVLPLYPGTPFRLYHSFRPIPSAIKSHAHIAGSALTWQGVKFEFAVETLILLHAPAPKNVTGRWIEGKLQQVPA